MVLSNGDIYLADCDTLSTELFHIDLLNWIKDNDILSARPNIKIIKIKQKDYNRDPESTINSLIKQLEDICQLT